MAAKILFIEDNPDHQLIVSRMLKKAGHDVSVEATGHDGIRAAKRGGIDLILLDYGLPDMDGMAVLAELTALGTPVVFVTGRSDQKLASEALTGGAANYVVKDAHYVTTLPEIVERTLNGHKPDAPTAKRAPRPSKMDDSYLISFREHVRAALKPLVGELHTRIEGKNFTDAVGQLEALLGSSEQVLDEELGALDELLYEELSRSMGSNTGDSQGGE